MTNQEYLQSVGIEMKVARIRKGLSSKEVAKLSGLHESTISELERGIKDAHILTYKRIADALKVDLKTFLSLPHAE